ncbi:MAG: ATP-dependent helicase, partial [Trueperaceae bacterium]|nr:ATP-dependent helicase [Trueperaceae bacterium]
MRVRVASAGTGKTTALVARVLQLVDEGVPLRRVAGVTYTRTAAAELRQRTGEGIAAVLHEGRFLGDLVVPDPAHRPRFEEAARELGGATLATIHGFLIAALRLVAPALAIDPAFVLQGEAEAIAAYEEEVRSLQFLAQERDHPLADVVARLGSEALPQALALFARRSLALELHPADAAAEDLLRLHEAAYERLARRTGAARLAPSEVERAAVRFARTSALVARVVARYPVVLVDEYQDVNPLQGRLFEALEDAGARVEVVGDPKQSIYGFRQADVAVFRRGAVAAAAAGTLDPPLTRTRRHARRIATFLNHLTGTLGDAGLGFARDEAPDVAPAGPQVAIEGRVELHWWRDEERGVDALRPAEGAWLGARLRALHDVEGRPWRSMAVVARSHAVLERTARALRAAGVPSVVRQGRGYFERPEVRDLVHAVRVAVDPRGASLAAWLRGPFGDAGVAFAAEAVRATGQVGAAGGGVGADDGRRCVGRERQGQREQERPHRGMFPCFL